VTHLTALRGTTDSVEVNMSRSISSVNIHSTHYTHFLTSFQFTFCSTDFVCLNLFSLPSPAVLEKRQISDTAFSRGTRSSEVSEDLPPLLRRWSCFVLVVLLPSLREEGVRGGGVGG